MTRFVRVTRKDKIELSSLRPYKDEELLHEWTGIFSALPLARGRHRPGAQIEVAAPAAALIMVTVLPEVSMLAPNERKGKCSRATGAASSSDSHGAPQRLDVSSCSVSGLWSTETGPGSGVRNLITISTRRPSSPSDAPHAVPAFSSANLSRQPWFPSGQGSNFCASPDPSLQS